jgi:hypothetical protein
MLKLCFLGAVTIVEPLNPNRSPIRDDRIHPRGAWPPRLPVPEIGLGSHLDSWRRKIGPVGNLRKFQAAPQPAVLAALLLEFPDGGGRVARHGRGGKSPRGRHPARTDAALSGVACDTPGVYPGPPGRDGSCAGMTVDEANSRADPFGPMCRTGLVRNTACGSPHATPPARVVALKSRAPGSAVAGPGPH